MAVELVLLEDVKDLGKLGAHVRVADGYARNFLIPKKLAAPVTKAAERILEARKIALQKEYEDRLAVAQSLAQRIKAESVTIPVEANEENKLYGSVTALQVIEALNEKGIELERHSVMLEDHIRELGVYSVDIHLHPQVQTILKVWVVRK